MIVGRAGKLDAVELEEFLLPTDYEEDIARRRARQGLKAEERSMIQAKEQIRQEAHRLAEEEERMRRKAKEAGQRFAQIESAGRARARNESISAWRKQGQLLHTLNRRYDQSARRQGVLLEDCDIDLLESEMSKSADGYPMMSSGLGKALTIVRNTLHRCLKHTLVPHQEHNIKDSGWLLASA